MAGSVWSAVTGPEGAGRFISQLSEVAENGWSSDFVEGLALTEALQAGQIGLEAYQRKLSAIAAGGGEFASHAGKMVELSRQLEGHSGFTGGAPAPATSLEDLEKASAAATRFEETASTALAGVKTLLSGVDFTYQGERMMETIAAGMRARAHLLVEEMRRVTQTLRDHLPSSPAKVGPLSDIHRLKFGETIAGSIRPAPMVNAMRKAARATMAAAMLSAATVSPALASTAPQPIRPPEQVLQQAGSGGGAGGSGQGGTISLTYAPVLHLGSGTAADEAGLTRILEEHADELVELLERKLEERRRLKF